MRTHFRTGFGLCRAGCGSTDGSCSPARCACIQQGYEKLLRNAAPEMADSGAVAPYLAEVFDLPNDGCKRLKKNPSNKGGSRFAAILAIGLKEEMRSAYSSCSGLCASAAKVTPG